MDCRIKKRSRLIPALVMALVFGALLSQAATSFANNAVNGDVLTDIQQVAKQKGITVEEAIARYGWQESFAKAVNLLRESFPDQYAGSAITNGGRGAWIAFKGEVPQKAVDLVATLPVTVRLIGSKGFSEAELKQTLDQAYYAIYEDGDIADAAGWYDVETGVITIEALPRQIPGDAVMRERLRVRLQPAQPANTAVTIKVSIVDELVGGVSADTTMRGGGRLEFINCTAGFTVFWTGDMYRGITTAHHCAKDYSSLRYYNWDDTGDYTNISRLGLGAPTYGDLAYYSRGTYSPTNRFYYDYGVTRSVLYAGLLPTVGQQLCKFGRTTGYSCDQVYKLNVCSGEYCGLTAMKSWKVSAGDSGGPWFWGNTAYGITQGSKYISFGYRDLFSPTYYLPDALGVDVLTFP